MLKGIAMTILVTGGCGYIGSHVAHALADAGEKPVCIDNLSAGMRTALPRSVPLIESDVGDADLVARTMQRHNVTAIIHLAASVSVEESVRNPGAYHHNNVTKMKTLLETAARHHVRHVLFSSSGTIYGDRGAEPIPEDAPLNPISPYGETKAEGEAMLHEMARAHGCTFAILRYFNVAGADPKLRTGPSNTAATHLITVAVDTALGRRQRLAIYGSDYPTPDGTCVRDYVHVSDLADIHLLAVSYLRGGGDSATLNCGYGRGFSVLDVIAAIKRVSGADFPVDHAARRPGDPATLVADNRRLQSLLHWTPRYADLDTIVGHALAWERARSS
jgi:UDP-glucose 4-epimerase